MKNPLVKIPLIVLTVAIVASVAWNIYRPQPVQQPMLPITDSTPTTPTPTDNAITTTMCYYQSTKTTHGLYDTAWLTFNISGQKITGEYHSLPAEKDAAGGTFVGVIDMSNPSSLSKIASVWWNELAEGMETTDELLIVYNNDNASIAYGDMVQNGDADTYVYKDKTKLTYGTPISRIDCGSLSEINTTQQYIKDNITTIIGTADTVTAAAAGQQANTWSVTTVVADPTTHTAEVSYTDGHVTHKANIAYTFDTTASAVTINSFTKE